MRQLDEEFEVIVYIVRMYANGVMYTEDTRS